MRRAQAACPLQRYAELDLPVAQHVGIGRATGAVLAQKMPEHPLTILTDEAGAMQRNAEFGRDRARVLEVPGAGAIRVVVLLPVAHEQALHFPPCILEQQRRDCGVDTPGKPDDDAPGAHRVTASVLAALAARRSSPATGSSARRWPAR